VIHKEAARIVTTKKLSMILALAKNGALGRGGKLPWSYPEDREHFDQTTRGHAVVMGRKTWEEEGEALVDRLNIVVSRTKSLLKGAITTSSLDEALLKAWGVDPNPFIIGGASIFTEVLPQVTTIYLTEIPLEPTDADVFYQLDRTGFVVTSERDGKDGVRFVVLERTPSSSSPVT
jgi:dihydrofolate reductase